MFNDVLESKIDIIERNIRFLREYDSVSPGAGDLGRNSSCTT